MVDTYEEGLYCKRERLKFIRFIYYLTCTVLLYVLISIEITARIFTMVLRFLFESLEVNHLVAVMIQ